MRHVEFELQKMSSPSKPSFGAGIERLPLGSTSPAWCLIFEIDCVSSTVILRRPRLPHFLDWLEVRRLAIGASRVDMLFRRHASSVAVNLLAREGDVEVEVVL